MNSTPFTAPRPTPTFYTETSFSTKRERSQTPREKLPPPLKPVSRKTLFSCRPSSNKKENRAVIVSINSPHKTLINPFYDPTIRELYFDQVFDIICKIGSGSFGEVYKVRCKCNHEFYAVKKSKQKFKSGIDRLNKLEEANRYEQLPYHRNCVKYIKAWEERDQLYIQTELCKTSLSDYADEHHNIPDRQIWNYLIDLLMAVKHLHDYNLIHLDIKPDNVFVNEDDVCKLGDFGLVFDLNKGSTDSAVEGDAKYLAPELMQGDFGKAADIFSLGITILELACDLDLPKGDDLWHQLRSKILPEDLLKEKPEELQWCIRWMMETDPSHRPTVDQILNHPHVIETWQRRLQEQIQLENKPKNKPILTASSPRKNKLWGPDQMHAIAERSAREEDEDKSAPVTSCNFSPPLITHPFLEKETSFTSTPLNEMNSPLIFSNLSDHLDSPDSPHINRSICDHNFNNNNSFEINIKNNDSLNFGNNNSKDTKNTIDTTNHKSTKRSKSSNNRIKRNRKNNLFKNSNILFSDSSTNVDEDISDP